MEAAHDFDAIRIARESQERTFKIGGETFAYQTAVRPEDLMPWYRMGRGEVTATQDEQLAIYDSTVLLFLMPGQEEKWRKARSAETDPPISLVDMRELIDWLFEEQAARPTEPPPASSTGSGSGGTGTALTDVSSSPEPTA